MGKGAECVSRQKSQIKKLYLKHETNPDSYIHLHAFLPFRTETKTYRFRITLTTTDTPQIPAAAAMVYREGYVLPGKSELSFGGYRAAFYPPITGLQEDRVYSLYVEVLDGS